MLTVHRRFAQIYISAISDFIISFDNISFLFYFLISNFPSWFDPYRAIEVYLALCLPPYWPKGSFLLVYSGTEHLSNQRSVHILDLLKRRALIGWQTDSRSSVVQIVNRAHQKTAFFLGGLEPNSIISSSILGEGEILDKVV